LKIIMVLDMCQYSLIFVIILNYVVFFKIVISVGFANLDPLKNMWV
jgi:hypothetical protein